MKKFYFFLLCMSLGFFSEAQSSIQKSTDSVAAIVQRYYNRQAVDSLYNLGGTGFKRALSQKKFTEVITGLHEHIGSLSSFSYISDNDNIAKYKANFSKAVMTMLIGLDETNKLKTFIFRAWEPDTIELKKQKVSSNNLLKTAIDRKVDSVIQPYITRLNTVGLVAGILHDGKTYTYGYGETVRGNKNIPGENTLFEIGSITKTFTATLLAEFVINKKIQLTDPVNLYLPDSIKSLVFNGKPVTVQSLANHSSGLPRLPANIFAVSSGVSNPYKNYNDSALFSFLKDFKPYREPGGQYEYSNLAVGILGVIFERASGKSYEQLVRERICKLLRMDQTKINLEAKDSALFAQGYNFKGEPVHSWEFAALAAAGAIRSNITDMLEYAKAQVGISKTSLQEAILLTHQQTVEHGMNKVGLGWHIVSMDGINYLLHNGHTGGYSCCIICDAKSDRAIVMLSNASVDTTQLALALISWLNKSAI